MCFHDDVGIDFLCVMRRHIRYMESLFRRLGFVESAVAGAEE